jgi:hypothetical protein
VDEGYIGADAGASASVRTQARVHSDACSRPRGRAGEGIRNLGGRGKVEGGGSERENGEFFYKNISFTQFQIC